MAKRTRRGNRSKAARGQMRNSRTPQVRSLLGREESGSADQHEKVGQANQPQFEWVAIEHRDADGNPTFPKELVAGTYFRKYPDVPDGTEIEALVLAGYKPNALMLVERKIYEIHRVSVQGWRRTGQIAVEVDASRQHETEWFDAMQGIRLKISDPGLPGPHSQESHYVVLQSSFQRKIVTSFSEDGTKTEVQMYEGKLDISETWKSVWSRQAAEIINMGFKLLILPLVSALIAGLAVWWIVRTPTTDLDDSSVSGSWEKHQGRSGAAHSPSHSPQESVNQLAPKGLAGTPPTGNQEVPESREIWPDPVPRKEETSQE